MSRLSTIEIKILFLFGLVALLSYFNSDKPRIFILHSSDPDIAFVQEFDSGTLRSLANNRLPISLKRHYLSLNRVHHKRDEVIKRTMAMHALRQFDPNLVITFGEDSNILISQVYEKQQRPDIVYSGILNPNDYYKSSSNKKIFGVRGGVPLDALKELLTEIYRDQTIKVSVVGRDNAAARATLKEISSYSWSQFRVQKAALFLYFDDLKSFIQSANQSDTNLLLVLNYAGLRDATTDEEISDREVVRWIESNSKSLPLGLQRNFVSDGASLAIEASRHEIGRQTMQMALDWLQSSRSRDMTPQSSINKHFDVAMRQDLLEKRGITLPMIFIEQARRSGQLF